MENNQINTLVFDWGNTIMADDSRNSGKMKDWPDVKAVDGAFHTLQKLSTDFNLILATNAEDSTSEDIYNALKRVDLDQFFTQVFTYRELNFKKPDPRYYNNLLKELDHTPDSVVMIGDDYIKDILGAKQAGWKTIWFNPEEQTVYAQLPLQDMEVRRLAEIPELLMKPFLPDVQTCLHWYMNLGVTHTLLAHVHNVAAIAYQIAIWFEQRGYQVSPLLAHRGGLTHDLAKLQKQGDKNHADLAAEFLVDKNQDELAEIARRHLIGDLLSEETRPQTWEQKIVNYADKLSEGNNLVSLGKRLAALKQRYPNFVTKIQKNTPLIKSLEQEIVTALEITPEQLMDDLKNSLFNRNSNFY